MARRVAACAFSGYGLDRQEHIADLHCLRVWIFFQGSLVFHKNRTSRKDLRKGVGAVRPNFLSYQCWGMRSQERTSRPLPSAPSGSRRPPPEAHRGQAQLAWQCRFPQQHGLLREPLCGQIAKLVARRARCLLSRSSSSRPFEVWWLPCPGPLLGSETETTGNCSVTL